MKCGDIFDRKYCIIEILGKGGMGTVYLARNIMLDTLWAIKEINKKDKSKEDILIEPNILKRLNHPSLPRIFDIIEDEQYVYIISDYIKGSSLDRELEVRGKFDESLVIEWAKQICDVLAYLHGLAPNPIIYRDMKPSNIILTDQGTIKLIDFGIAREYKKDANNDTVYIGTRGYAAPEQYGCGQTSPMSDIYSLGITLYHLLTGKSPNNPPFEVKPLRHYNPDISEKMEGIIAKCMQVEPDNRYKSARELKNYLEFMDDKSDEEGFKNYSRSRNPSFKRLVLAVCDNAEFSCEFAYAAARMSELEVALIDMDFSSIKVNFHMGLEEQQQNLQREYNDGFGRAIKIASSNVLNIKEFKKTCSKVEQCSNLYLLSSPSHMEAGEEYKAEEVEKLLELAYKTFDLTIVSVGGGYSDKLTKSALEMSNYNIMAVRANMDVLIDYQNYIEYLNKEYSIPIEKFKLVAWEYIEDVNLPKKLLKKSYGGNCYIGKLKYDSEREKWKNLHNKIYAKAAWKKHIEEYSIILEAFNITVRKKWGEHLKSKLIGILRKTREEGAVNE